MTNPLPPLYVGVQQASTAAPSIVLRSRLSNAWPLVAAATTSASAVASMLRMAAFSCAAAAVSEAEQRAVAEAEALTAAPRRTEDDPPLVELLARRKALEVCC